MRHLKRSIFWLDSWIKCKLSPKLNESFIMFSLKLMLRFNVRFLYRPELDSETQRFSLLPTLIMDFERSGVDEP